MNFDKELCFYIGAWCPDYILWKWGVGGAILSGKGFVILCRSTRLKIKKAVMVFFMYC